ncbi:MAG: hypothetical protein KAG89_12470 [Fulvimarina manganoxydans]|nr:hypothetical protein [Fulvimarina manganoxydans]
MPFEKRGKRFLTVQPAQCRSEENAIGRAERDAKRFAGVIAFRQVEKDDTGEVLDESAIFARHGQLLADIADE